MIFFWLGTCDLHVSTRLFGFSLAACLFAWFPDLGHVLVLRLEHQRSCFELVFDIAFGLNKTLILIAS